MYNPRENLRINILGLYGNSSLTMRKQEKRMRINFILFIMVIEKYSRWSNLKVTKDNKEYIIDFGYYRFFIYQSLCLGMNFVIYRAYKINK